MAAIGIAFYSPWNRLIPYGVTTDLSVAWLVLTQQPSPTAVSPLVPFTNYGALLSLASAQMWLKVARKSNRTQCSPRLFSDMSALHKTVIGPYSQGTVRRLICLQKCYSCGIDAPFTQTANGDHVVAKSQGGSLGIDNFAPMCRSCNSQKGTFDLLYWWGERKRRTLEELNDDVIVVYIRQKYLLYERNGCLDDKLEGRDGFASKYLLWKFGQNLPTSAHTEAFNRIGIAATPLPVG
jgi:hypothetical protein